MKQQERNQKSRELILEHAFREFAAQGYLGTSVNAICASGGISKGLLYHYYTDKDMLYLGCVQKCFDDITADLKECLGGKVLTVDAYFEARLEFFRRFPLHQQLFFDVAVNPPQHLRQELSQCRQLFDTWNEKLLTSILSTEKLAQGFTQEDAVCMLRIFGDLVSAVLKNVFADGDGKMYEQLCQQVLHTMLYGMIERKK